jgi:hypothetical protein
MGTMAAIPASYFAEARFCNSSRADKTSWLCLLGFTLL